MKEILCWLVGIHDWLDVLDNKIFPFTPYRYYPRCGKNV